MKKILAVLAVLLVFTGFLSAGGLDFHLGAGYHSAYLSDALSIPDDPTAMPLGVGAYAGIGYGFGEKKVANLGLEFAPSWDVSFDPLGASNFMYQVRAYAKFKPLDMLTATLFGAYEGNAFFGTDTAAWQEHASWAVGARLTLFFIYAEYSAVLNEDVSDIGVMKNEIGLGFAIFK